MHRNNGFVTIHPASNFELTGKYLNCLLRFPKFQEKARGEDE